MKKILAVVSDEAYEVLREYKEANNIKNLDTALDELLRGIKRGRDKGRSGEEKDKKRVRR
ncbi:hypothetical protein DRO24_01495 [Candidatus Bathyarchaeota archaeon]|nr:MAG: hypothetical protein DRO24_01495 [Candidatus Bathyarchaeota archaeon]